MGVMVNLVLYVLLTYSVCCFRPAFGAEETLFVFGREQDATPCGKIALDGLQDLVGKPVNFSFYDKDGNKLRIEDFKEKSLFVYLWAPWCLDCVSGVKNVAAMAAEFAGQFRDDIKIIPISLDGSVANIEHFYATHGIANLDIFFLSNDSLGEVFENYTVPTAMTVDSSGRAVEVISGVICCNLGRLQGMIR